MISRFKPLIQLSDHEKERFSSIIQKERKIRIPSAETTIKEAKKFNQDLIEGLLNNGKISEAIVQWRKFSYDYFLEQERNFNGVILKEIANIFEGPKELLTCISNKLYALSNISEAKFYNELNQYFGVYSGYISPYIYQLCLSNTQSRRSRAGKEFEQIVYSLYDYFGFAFESQASIGKKSFSKLGLGKVVDSIIPNTDAFSKLRIQTIVGSMKTTLRERWQEVVEEIQRSSLPNIYLLTVDNDISDKKIAQMREHNIVLVVLDSVKRSKKLSTCHNVIDFEYYFSNSIPDVLNYWEQHI